MGDRHFNKSSLIILKEPSSNKFTIIDVDLRWKDGELLNILLISVRWKLLENTMYMPGLISRVLESCNKSQDLEDKYSTISILCVVLES